jgi:hypothetical protein
MICTHRALQGHRVIVLRGQARLQQTITCGSELAREGTSKFTPQFGYQAASPAFDLAFDLRRPVKPRWPESDVEVWGEPAGMPV